ncbi:Membrane cofactor protein [Anabarilius grahami]|uniref:Membrane cofactor protein n=1 Tax=Anabarilius grahami TaxID=495550 RepID=A0A3N0YXN4_ANAGA|nr:Membrane cofactor protein [Anabarilius grahami]
MTSVKAWPLLLLQFSLVSMGKGCPFPVLNGKLILSEKSRQINNFPDNSNAFVECPKGHESAEGSNVIICTNGKWSDPELKCKMITCDEPNPIEHGKFSKPRNIIQLDDVVEYSCDDNYTLVGNKSITCGQYWEYSSPPPQCKAIKCRVPKISLGNRTEGNPPFSYKSEAAFECWPGYRMKGLAPSVCEESGWSALPVCVEGKLNLLNAVMDGIFFSRCGFMI